MPDVSTILLAGASRGLGLGLAHEYLARGWNVVATARAPANATGLAELHAAHPDRLRIETLDVADPASCASLADRLRGTALDVLFVVAGVSSYGREPIQDVPFAAAGQEFITNAVGPLHLAEALLPSVVAGGTVVFMTSILGSIGSNAGGGTELYRASKAALNMLASCFALRHRSHPVVLMHPGWVRTEMGGPNAHIDVPTSAKGMADVIEQRRKSPGLIYLDYQGTRLPW
jgi:NAD(P)-dependent dehydrogenase (short-subunit alcohol dehydrogenase family)